MPALDLGHGKREKTVGREGVVGLDIHKEDKIVLGLGLGEGLGLGLSEV
jgi:hypothetical protein